MAGDVAHPGQDETQGKEAMTHYEEEMVLLSGHRTPESRGKMARSSANPTPDTSPAGLVKVHARVLLEMLTAMEGLHNKAQQATGLRSKPPATKKLVDALASLVAQTF